MMRIIINTGKGGVGKTTISALTAINISKRFKTLVVSSDTAHSLSDLFEKPLSNEARLIDENLYALEINPLVEGKKAWGKLNSYLREIIKNNAMDDVQTDELLLMPGLDDIFCLLKILEIYKEGKYEALVVDCGPSGETISFLSTGEKLKNLADNLLPTLKRFNNIFGGFIEKKTEVKKPKDIVFDEFIKLSNDLYELEEILRDKKITSIRLVSKANRVIANEAFRTYSLANLYGFTTDLVFINMIFPDQLKNTSYANLLDEERENIKRIEEYFFDKEIIKLSLQDDEVIGIKALNILHDKVFSNYKLEDVFVDYEAFEIIQDKASKIISIEIREASNKEVNVEKIGNDLEISYLNFKRRFKLPDSVSSRKISSFSLKDNKLRIVMDYDWNCRKNSNIERF